MSLQIGTEGWVRELKDITRPFGPDFWSGFSPVASSALKGLEQQIQRKLPDEFVEFYRTIGCGYFPDRRGWFDTPEEIVMALSASIYFILGSLGSSPWCSEEEHKHLWRTRGDFNPAPDQFTDETLTLEGVKLYDLLQFGSDGLACYHQLYVGPQPSPLGYCLLTDSQTMEDSTPTFSEGVERLLRRYESLSA
jgi:hypothetical protein